MVRRATELEGRFKLGRRRWETLEPLRVEDRFAIACQVLQRPQSLTRETCILLHDENCQRGQGVLPAVVHDAAEHFGERAGAHINSFRDDGVREYLAVVGCADEDLPGELSTLSAIHRILVRKVM